MNIKNELIIGVISFIVILILTGMAILQYAKDSKPPMYPTSQNNGTGTTNSTASQNTGTSLTEAEVSKHMTSSDCYLIIEQKVYDVTSYISRHPGGAGRIIPYCGQDATQAFVTQGGRGAHSSAAYQDLSSLYIGDLNKTQVKQVDTNAVQSLPVRGEREEENE